MEGRGLNCKNAAPVWFWISHHRDSYSNCSRHITTYGYAIINIPQQSQHFSQQKYLLSIYRIDTKRERTTISLVFKEIISVYNMCISLNWS